jgi:iron complex outermembrane receptor protein
LSRFVLSAGASTRILGYVHPNDLQTETEEAGEVAEVKNEAFDFGLGLARSFAWTERLGGRLGVDYFGRRHVNAFESSHPADGGPSTPEQATLRRGFQDELGLYGAATRPVSAVTLQGGVRGTWRRQGNTGWEDETDIAANAFAGAVAKIGQHWHLSGEVANGIRFPSLSERFFTGTTGRGGIIGNPDLERERSTSVDLGLDLSGERGRAQTHGFYTRVNDYIERVEVEPDLFTFQNLVSGRITGLEVEGQFDLTPAWGLSGHGQVISSRDRDGEPLADCPAHRFQVQVERRFARFACDAGYEYRFAKDDPGPGEKEIGDAHLLTLGGRCDLGRGLAGTLSVANLLDESYFLAADARTPLAAGRSVAIGLSFQQ